MHEVSGLTAGKSRRRRESRGKQNERRPDVEEKRMLGNTQVSAGRKEKKVED